MLNKRRYGLQGLLALLLAFNFSFCPPATATDLDTLHERGRLRIAVYNDFPPYSQSGAKGIDADLGRALAAKLGLVAEIVGFNADEDMNDDLRNMVWKGHYLGTQPADVMLHVPVDAHLARANDKVRIFGAYHRETLAVARNPTRVPPLAGSAAVGLEAFTREKIGVETATLADAFLLGVLNGRLSEHVVHFRSISEAAHALRAGQLAAVLAPRSELEAALREPGAWVIEAVKLAELSQDSWLLGMAVKAEAHALASALEQALKALHEDGTLAAIFRQHHISHAPF